MIKPQKIRRARPKFSEYEPSRTIDDSSIKRLLNAIATARRKAGDIEGAARARQGATHLGKFSRGRR